MRCGGLKRTPPLLRARPCGRVRGPGAVAFRQGERLGVRRLVRLPLQHGPREGEFLEAPAELLRELGLQCRAIEGRRFVGLDLEHRAALHELALDAEERLALRMRGDQAIQVGLDAEELRDEVVQHRRHGQQKIGLLLGGKGLRRESGGQKAGVEVGVAGRKRRRETARRGASSPSVS